MALLFLLFVPERFLLGEMNKTFLLLELIKKETNVDFSLLL